MKRGYNNVEDLRELVSGDGRIKNDFFRPATLHHMQVVQGVQVVIIGWKRGLLRQSNLPFTIVNILLTSVKEVGPFGLANVPITVVAE
eukprot:9138316-Ditylum_brightwellii.AAC.1